MPKVEINKSSINAGEFSPRMKAQTGFALYPNAAEILENFLILPTGGATRRPGTHFVAEAKASSGPYRLVPFERSADQAYILEFGDGYLRFYTRQGQIEDSGSPGTPYEISTPYTGVDLFLLNWAQQDDIMILVHPEVPPHQLNRFGEDDWTIEELEFDEGPLQAENETAITIQASATTGTITLTASAALWTADHVGALFGLANANGVIGSTTWAPGQTIGSTGLFRQLEGRLYKSNSTGTTGSIALTHDTGTVSDGGVDWTYVQTGLFGIVRITAFTSSTEVDCVPTIGSIVPSLLTIPSAIWREGSWSDVAGYPRAVTLLDNRAWYAGTTIQPQTAWGSAVGDFDNFRLQGTVADDPFTDDGAIEAKLQSNQVSPILWLTVRDDIIAGTTSGPWKISANDGGVITPLNVQARRQSTISASIIPALDLNSSLMFVPRNKRKLYDLRFDFDVDRFEGVDQTLLADHILESGVVEMAYQSQPLSTLWVLRSDGVLSTFAFNRAEEIRGWCRQIVSGTDCVVKSVAVIPGDDQTDSEDRDEVWVAVERTVDGSTVTYVEFFEGLHEEDDAVYEAWHLDSALQFNGASTTSISGLDHLEGEEVAIWGDSGAVEANKTVSSGAITLDNAVTSAVVGLPTTYTYTTLPMDYGSPTGTALTKKQRFSEVRFLLYLTSGLKVSEQGTDLSDIYDIDRRILQSDIYERVTGTYGVRCRDSGWRHNPALTFSGDTPAPVTILGIVPFLSTSE